MDEIDEETKRLSNEYQRVARAGGTASVEQKAAHSARMRLYQRKQKDADPEGYRKRTRRRTVAANANGMNAHRQRRANRKRRVVIDAIKLHAGCADCGAKQLHPACYDFDHLPSCEKSFSIGVNMRRGWSRILDEIQKCEVVCANCHRVRTLRRKGELLETPDAQEHIDHVGRVRDLYGEAEVRGLLPPRKLPS